MGRSNDTMKRIRKERISRGLCPVCGEPNDRFPKYNCSACLERHNERARKWRLDRLASHTCPQCGNEMDREGWCCQSCYQKIKTNIKESRCKKTRTEGV